VADYLKLRPDVTVSAATLDQLADRRNLPAASLKETVATVNRQRSGESDLPGLNDAGPWVLLGPLKAYFTTTEGGAAIDQQFQVLDEHSQKIPGLYAVGQNGLGGQILWGHGLHIAWALTSGRLVAEQLAAGKGSEP
jgi:fumarate reductase flavoprotein subunit